MPQLIEKYDAEGNLMPADTTEHSVLLLDGLYIDVRKPKKHANWAAAMKACAKVNLMDRTWRGITLQELVARLDYTRINPAIDRTLFPHMPDYGWVWTSTEYAGDEPSSPSFAWGVGLDGGYASVDYRYDDGLALPVCVAGQS